MESIDPNTPLIVRQAWRSDVPALLRLEVIGPDQFRCRVNQPNFQASIYGGQLLGQALAAASITVEVGRVRSLQSYFLNAGDRNRPIDFRVARLRDSDRSAIRSIVATQGDNILFEMRCMFRVSQPGFLHQLPACDVPQPDLLEDLSEIARADRSIFGDFGDFVIGGQSIQIRPLSRGDLADHRDGDPSRRFWVRVPSAVGTDDPAIHTAILAYLSDYWFGRVCLIPHRSPVPDRTYHFASIDHCMWFHGTARADEWLLYNVDSPSVADGTGFVRGLLYDRNLKLVASTAQEVLHMASRVCR